MNLAYWHAFYKTVKKQLIHSTSTDRTIDDILLK